MTRDQLLAAMQRECDIIVHLFSKIPDGTLDFRFTDGQRTTLELLQYLSFVGVATTRAITEGSFDHIPPLSEKSKALRAEDFPAAMEAQKATLADLFAGITDEQWTNSRYTMPWGQEMSWGEALTGFPYACFVAYRMQLFLHAKAAGNADINTMNCWAGMDAPTPADAE